LYEVVVVFEDLESVIGFFSGEFHSELRFPFGVGFEDFTVISGFNFSGVLVDVVESSGGY